MLMNILGKKVNMRMGYAKLKRKKGRCFPQAGRAAPRD